MKIKIVTVFLSMIMVVILAGCTLSETKITLSDSEQAVEDDKEQPSPAVEENTASEEIGDVHDEGTVETVEEQSEEVSAEPDQVNEYWKKLYLIKLDRLREYTPAFNPDIPVDEYTPIEYLLYDIDKDGIPEMIIKYGTCEADYHGDIYTNDGYAVKPVETDIGLGHTVFYTDPDENGIILNWAHMGSQGMEKISIVDGKLKTEELYDGHIEEEDDYTEPDTIVPGAIMISMAQMYQSLYVTHYEDIMKGMTTQAQPSRNVEPDRGLADAVDDVITNGGAVVCSSADAYGPHLGTIPFDEMLQKIDQWSKNPFEVESKEYIDLNDDGRQECVLWLKQQNDGYDSVDACILNLQDGKMYAYVLEYINGYTLQDNGTFAGTEYNEPAFRLLFDHDECMRYYVSR